MLRTYVMSAGGIRRLMWRSARLSVATTLLLIALAMRLGLASDHNGQRDMSLIAGYLLCVLVFGTWLNTRSTRRVWTSYRLDLSEDDLRRTQAKVPEIRIGRGEVTKIEEMPGRGMVVRTADSERFVFVPDGLAGYEDVRRELGVWAPVLRLSQSVTWSRQWAGVTAAFLIVVWMLGTMISKNAIFVIPSAFAISVFLLWTLVAAQRSLHLASRTRRAMWLVVFPILALTLKSTKLLVDLGLR